MGWFWLVLWFALSASIGWQAHGLYMERRHEELP
jgi:hypothetical protein